MSEQKTRPAGEPGKWIGYGNASCGYDGGNDDAPMCGEHAAYHLITDGEEGFTMSACVTHLPAAQAHCFDWHEHGAVCNMPSTVWQFGTMQGESFCFWPEAESLMHEQVAEREQVSP